VVNVLVPGASGPGSSPGRGHCVVFLGKTHNSFFVSHVFLFKYYTSMNECCMYFSNWKYDFPRKNK